MPSTISIIVPLSGGAAQALRCFEGIAIQPEEPAHEIIVVDDASADLEPLLSRLKGDVQVVRNDRRLGFAAAAMRGAHCATGDVVAFIRDAAVPRSGWLAPLADALTDPGIGFVASGSENPVAAYAFAVRAADLRAVGMPAVPAPLVAGALSLSLAE